MSAKLANAPLYYALAQVRFNPVALMPKFADEIQDRLRRSGYPIFEKEVAQNIELDLSQNHDAKPTITEMTNWFFTSPDKHSGYVLGKDFLNFQTTNYDCHEDFFKSFCDGLSLLNEIVDIGIITRLGVRYLDAVIPNDGESINKFLHQQVQGVDFGLPWLGGAWESGFSTELGTLIAKIYKTPGSLLGFPADLQPRSVVMHERFVLSQPKEHAVIDIDHFTQTELPADTQVISAQLIKLHESILACFSTIATPHAFERWS